MSTGAVHHLDAGGARRYVDGSLDDVAAAGADAHLEGCAACRAAVAAAVRGGPAGQRLDAVWAAVEAEVGVVAVVAEPWLVRALRRLGVDEPTARLVAAAPSLRLPYLLASAVVGTAAVLLAAGATGGGAQAVFLVLAPLLPVVAVAGAYGSGDPAHELAVAAPVDSVRLALLRTAAVLALVAVPVAVVGAAVLRGPLAAAWLLPSAAFVAVVLVASCWVPAGRAAAAVGTAWAVVVVVAEREADAAVLVGAAGQVAAAAVAVVAAVALRTVAARATPS